MKSLKLKLIKAKGSEFLWSTPVNFTLLANGRGTKAQFGGSGIAFVFEVVGKNQPWSPVNGASMVRSPEVAPRPRS
ncbi:MULTISPECIES: hypothetical protein [Roseobacteraceae]|uniref:hypothetical protein n=1 Tax=Roseobacteraceae TaxID=2854170 RepID=UPI0012FE4B8E|nr:MULTISPECIES: hypothetical protein [Roseobacteraceae]